ncbi:MAG TPA: GTPase Era [Clostridia bacterium]|nr:GTPase Era [Clostridia bacterium]
MEPNGIGKHNLNGKSLNGAEENPKPEGATPHKFGFVALVGRPNVGKSTLVNRLVGQKVAIVSEKPQTTRNRVTGILTLDDSQIVFVDTPGIHRPRHRLGKYMVTVAQKTLEEVDVILFVTRADKALCPEDEEIAEKVRRSKVPQIIALNMMDLVETPTLLPLIDAFHRLCPEAEIVPVSALRGTNVDRLLEVIKRCLPEGPAHYPPGAFTDQPEQFIVAEIIREKMLERLRDEVPHSVGVRVEEWREEEEKPIYIRATIYVEKESQKPIIIGRGGKELKEIGKAARLEIEFLLGVGVYLELWVKVRKGWRNDESTLRMLGYDQRNPGGS